MIFQSWRNKSDATDPSKFVIQNDSFLFNIRFQNIRLQNGVRSAQQAFGKSRNLDFICYRTRAQKCKYGVRGSAAKSWPRLIGGGVYSWSEMF